MQRALESKRDREAFVTLPVNLVAVGKDACPARHATVRPDVGRVVAAEAALVALTLGLVTLLFVGVHHIVQVAPVAFMP